MQVAVVSADEENGVSVTEGIGGDAVGNVTTVLMMGGAQ